MYSIAIVGDTERLLHMPTRVVVRWPSPPDIRPDSAACARSKVLSNETLNVIFGIKLNITVAEHCGLSSTLWLSFHCFISADPFLGRLLPVGLTLSSSGSASLTELGLGSRGDRFITVL